MTAMTERLMLLDSASLYFRAFYGVPDTRRSPADPPTVSQDTLRIVGR